MTDEPGGPPGEYLGLLLQLAHRTANKAFTEALSGLDIAPRHFGVLLQLARRQPLSQRQLSELLGDDKSAMVRIVDELEQRGLVVRGAAEHDRRAHAIALTDVGRDLHRVAVEAAVRTSEQVFGRLTAAEQRHLHALLGKIIDSAVAELPSSDRDTG